VRTVSNRLGHAVHPPRLTSTGPGCPPETATPRSTSKPSSDQADPHSWATQAGIRPITGDMMPTREAVAEGVLRGAREGPI
jgi:hypothetical protein